MKYCKFIALLLTATCGFIQAQIPYCGFDVLRNELHLSNPQNRVFEQDMHQAVFRTIVTGESKKVTGTPLVIPLVFHIMHNNGPENVADSVIINAVSELNLRFQNAAPYYDSTGNVMNIQFCLASVNPQGNPATGITRTLTTLTNLNMFNDDENMKNLSRWSPLLYCNVWVVADIVGFPAGYATYPNSAGTSVDGIVMEAAYITNSHILAHELGHFLGLAHTFSFSCTNFNCLLDGDQVCDTPPDTSQFANPCMWNSCSTDTQDTTGFSPFIMDVNEHPNYMDYTYCPLSFTQGQGERMEIMANLYRSGLFSSNGCGANPGQAVPVAGFNFMPLPCNNGKVSFSDSLSVNSLTTEWDFNNDGFYEVLAHDITHTFPATGTYPVRQRVTGFGGQDSITHMVSVMKGTTYNYPIIFPLQSLDTVRVCSGDTITFIGETNAQSYLWSTGATTPSISFVASTNIDISLTITDSNGFTWDSQCTPIHVQVYPNTIPVITYDDTVGYLCQGQIVHLYITNAQPGVYSWQVYTTFGGWFNTQDHNLFYNYSPDPVNGNQFYVTYTNPAGCNLQSNIITVQPQMLPFLNGVPLFTNGYDIWYNAGSHPYQWYNYNVPIPGATNYWYTVTSTGCYRLKAWNAQYPACESYSDSICFQFTGIQDLSSNFFISPNPVID
jgi:hypothetical protein